MLDYKLLNQHIVALHEAKEEPTLPSIERSRILLEKVFSLEKGASVILSGSDNTIKHATLLKAVVKSGKKSIILDFNEVVSNGVIDDDKMEKVIRSTTRVTIKEHLRIVEGEVTALSSDRVTLKTQDMESEFEIGLRMRKQFVNERIAVGDVVKIYKENCYVKRLGRASNIGKSTEFEMLPVVAVPEGECIKLEAVESEVTLDELDILNANENGEEFLYTNCLADKYIKEEVNKKVCKWIKENKAVVSTGVLIFDNCKSSELCKVISQRYEHIMFAPTFVFILDSKYEHKVENTIKENLFVVKIDDVSEYDLLSYQMSISNIQASAEDIRYLADLAKEKGFKNVNKIIASSVVNQVFNRDAFLKLLNLFDFN